MNNVNIRLECLRPAEQWSRPTGEEIREVLRLAGLTGSQAAKKLGLGPSGSRTVRRWTGEESNIPYSAWGQLCYLAGLGVIWKES
ncbi:transcriptional regulator [Vibrio sp. 1733]|jgi:hypothetical protein|uniref:KorC protein n=2 Tax=Vibrionaceae TaxID=641 RepID=C5NNC9_PHODP|nr:MULTISPECIES: KorC protein [Gammaproteobacteria]MBE4026144.1 transcriptional regulator [Vibrio parahaemolyticus]MBU2867488.1 transcriptional regulator [Pacificibacter marinus]MBU2897116.1 transcriptional regulator [Vibrio hepatarius]MBU2952331.1 transcriptional regulator [Marinobacter sp. F3R08]MCA2452725.1 transcriptional regulator [Vibrio alginolyticus]